MNIGLRLRARPRPRHSAPWSMAYYRQNRCKLARPCTYAMHSGGRPSVMLCILCNNMPKACLHQEIVRALGLGLRGAKRRRCRLRIRGQIAPAVLSRHSSLKKHRLVPSPLRGRGAFGAVLRASRAILTRL